MNRRHRRRSILKATVQSGLPTWSSRANEALSLSEGLHQCDRFFYYAFGECDLPTMIYNDQGERLVEPLRHEVDFQFANKISALAQGEIGARFIFSDETLVFAYDDMKRWPLAPQEVAYVVTRIDRSWFNDTTDLDLTPSEFTLVGLMLSGRDLAAAALEVGASYDTKRKQVRQIFEKADVKGQAALLREVSLALTSAIFAELLRPDQKKSEVELAQRVFGRDVVVHSISFGTGQEVPVWEFGARRGLPVFYFHSMLAPIMFDPDMAKRLKNHNIRILSVPRHFVDTRIGVGNAQQKILRSCAEIVEYFCDEPVICLGESAGCSWAAQFSQYYPSLVSEVVFVATPQAINPEDVTRVWSRTETLFNEVSTHVRRDERVIAGLTRIYNTIARVPALARRSLDFMLRHSPADQASIHTAFNTLALEDWLRLIANKSNRSSIDEIVHLHSDWVHNLEKIERPIRFFHGTEDPLCPIEDAEAMAAGLSGADFTAFDDAGHLVLGQRLNHILDALFVNQKSNENVTEQSV